MQELKELKNLKTRFIGRNILYYDKINSTQELARGLSNKDVQNGTCIIAKNQTKGIGTKGRTWYTEEGKNITMTIIVFPNCSIKDLDNITIKIATCMVETIKKLYNINLKIKEPNDLMINSKKLGGILTETKVQNEIVTKMLIGIGMNINGTKMPEELKKIATSLKIECFEKEYDIEKIITEFLNKIEENIL